MKHDTVRFSNPKIFQLDILEDPSDREQDLLKIDSTLLDEQLAWSPRSPPHCSLFSRTVSEPCSDLTPSQLSTAVRIYKSHGQIHTLDENGEVGKSPHHVWSAHAHAPIFPAITLKSSRPLPTKARRTTFKDLTVNLHSSSQFSLVTMP